MASKFSIAIEDTEINLMVTNRERIEKWANIALEPGLVSGGAIQDEAKMASFIQSQLKLLKIRESKAIIGFAPFG